MVNRIAVALVLISVFVIGIAAADVPVVSFTMSATNGTPPMTLILNDTTVTDPLSWNWSFQNVSGNNTEVWFSQDQNTSIVLGVGDWFFRLTAINVSGSAGSTQDGWVNVSVSNATASSSSDNTQMYSTPHKVRFVAQTYQSTPIVGMNVTAVGVESSLGSLDWVSELFGINLATTPILNTTMTATTGSDGAVVFLMIETEKYALHYTYPALSINETRYYYPQQEEYLEIFWTESVVLPTPTLPVCGSPDFNYSTVNNISGVIDVSVTYFDCSGRTANATFYVINERNKQPLYRVNVSSPNDFNITYPLRVSEGTAYSYGISGKTLTGGQVYQNIKLVINGTGWKYNPLMAKAGDKFAIWFYNLISVGLIVMFGWLFGRWSIKAGVVVVPLIGLALSGAYMGWLMTGWGIVSVATVLGVMTYLRFAEEESQL